jgi:hypothetical protein
MTRIHGLLCGMTAITLLATPIVAPLGAQEQQPDLPEMSDAARAEMNAWMELRNPGEHHKHLEAYAGNWTSEVTMWMEPGATPMTEKATAEARMILGGRYLEWKHSGVFGGMPFAGRQMDAYNNADKRYEAMWADNFGTLILFYTGECEDDGKMRTMRTEFSDPLRGGTLTNRVVWTWQDADNILYESYMSRDGEEHKNMEIRYTRTE